MRQFIVPVCLVAAMSALIGALAYFGGPLPSPFMVIRGLHPSDCLEVGADERIARVRCEDKGVVK